MSESPSPSRAPDKDEVAAHVREVLRAEYKDARSLEFETAERIANRVMGWAKIFGFFAGIPLVLIALWLGWLGYKSIADVGRLVDKLEAQIATLQKDVDAKRAQLAKLNELDTLEQRLNGLSSRVASLESLEFGGSASVAPDAKRRIEDAITRYQAYFAALGFRFGSNQETHVQIEKSQKMEEHGGALAYYDSAKNALVVDEKYIVSDDIVLHEYTHLILVRANPRFKDTEDSDFIALEQGLAHYFPRSFAGSPAYVSIPEFTLTNDRKVLAAPGFGDVQNVAFAWGALGWDLRTKIGREAADKLLWEAWKMMQSRGPATARDFARALLAADGSLNRGANAALIRTTMTKRGVSL